MFDYKELVKKEVVEALESPEQDWIETFSDKDSQSKQEIIWFLKELLEKDEDKKFINKIMTVAELYSSDEDPSPGETDFNKKTLAGDEIRFISTVRGTACWLLVAIAATFKTEYYPRIISILEKLSSDPVYYVRIQTTVPLSFFAANIRAIQHTDGTPFDFKEADKARVTNLSFKLLQEHRDIPRVLEGVTHVFDALRGINETQARQVVSYLFRNSKKEMQPEYLTRQAIPLLIFFAEYRSKLGDGFNGSWFQDYAKELLSLPEVEAPYLRSTFEWHTWKEIERDASSYEQLKKYIPLFIHPDVFEQQPLSQYDFLILQVLKVAPNEGVELFQILLNYIERWAYKYDIREHAWMLSGGEILEAIAPVAPDKLVDILSQIVRILSKRVWIGNMQQMFKSYLLVKDEKKRQAIYSKLQELHKQAKSFEWAGQLGDI